MIDYSRYSQTPNYSTVQVVGVCVPRLPNKLAGGANFTPHTRLQQSSFPSIPLVDRATTGARLTVHLYFGICVLRPVGGLRMDRATQEMLREGARLAEIGNRQDFAPRMHALS